MLYTVSFDRLDKYYTKSRQNGRQYMILELPGRDLDALYVGVRAYLHTVLAATTN